MTKKTRGLLARSLVTLLVVSAAAPVLAALPVTRTDQLCADEDDPCIVTGKYVIADGAALDFGVRAVLLRGAHISIGNGRVTIESGEFRMDRRSSIRARGRAEDGIREGGSIDIFARRACSDDPDRPCTTGLACALGTCSVGEAVAVLEGKINARGNGPGQVYVSAVDDIVMAARTKVDGIGQDSDGGEIELESREGSIDVLERVRATSGKLSGGGDFSARAGIDVNVVARVNVNGGDFDGGYVELEAGRDIRISSVLSASAVAGEGYGGEFDFYAGRDVTIAPTPGGGRPVLVAKGHRGGFGGESYGGGGGLLGIVAGRSVHVDRRVLVDLDGATPDGYGGDVDIEAGLDVVLEGAVSSTGVGPDGAAGFVDIVARRNVTFASTSTFYIRGDGRDGGGSVYIEACNFVAAGAASFLNLGEQASNEVDVGGAFIAERGSTFVADPATGTNTIYYRSAALPPVLDGDVVPAPQLFVDPGLPACPQ